MRRAVNITLLFTLLLTGCISLPLHNAGIDDPALQKIATRYEQVIKAAHNDPDTVWQSGWVGNMWIHYSDNTQRGLCYEWKHLVYDGVVDTVHQVGWQARGIAVKEGTAHEHHAVIVFDPKRINADNLLHADYGQAYVLDAWLQGKADIFHLRDWLNSFAVDTTVRVHNVTRQHMSQTRPGNK